MNTKELMAQMLEQRRRYKRLEELSKNILVSSDPLLADAAQVIQWLQGRIVKLEQELHEERREGDRAARDAYAQGQQDQAERDRDTW